MTTTTEQEVFDRAEIKDGKVLVSYSRTEAALADLKQRYEGVLFDCDTTKGDKAAREARQLFVGLRTGLEKKRKEFKAPALEFGKRIDEEAKRITSAIVALEEPIDAQIVAVEQRKAAEKAERDRIEAERVAKHEAALNRIRAYPAQAREKNLSSEAIGRGIAVVEAIDVGPEWQEYQEKAQEAKAHTIAALRAHQDDAKAREEYEAHQQAIRAENERMAAELAEQRRALAEAAAEVQRQKDAIEAERAAAAEAARRAEADRVFKARQEELEREEEAARAEAHRKHEEALAEAARLQVEEEARPAFELQPAGAANEPVIVQPWMLTDSEANAFIAQAGNNPLEAVKAAFAAGYQAKEMTMKAAV